MTRALDLRLHDTTIGIWQEDPHDPTFRTEIYEGVLKLLRRRRWKVAADPRVLKHYPSLSKDNRLGSRGDLRVEVHLSGRSLSLEFWAENYPSDHPNGHRYDFDKRLKLDFLDRVRVDLETQKITAWLEARATVTLSDASRERGLGRGKLTALQYVAADYARSSHKDKALGRPVCIQAYNSKSADDGVVEHGATVWFADQKGRLCRGQALYNINSMWWVVTGRFSLENKSSFEIYVRSPADLRRKRNDRARRARLEGQLRAAIRTSDFARAALLKAIAFGDAPIYGIWSRKWESHYATNSSGYTKDGLSAGRYTWAEAVAEVQRVPHILSLVMPDGSHLAADALEHREAA